MEEMKPLSEYLKGIQSYVGYGSDEGLKEFSDELNKVPNVEERFKKLLANEQIANRWVNLAEENLYFLLDRVIPRDERPNNIRICIFDNGTKAVIKVEKYN